MANHTIHISGEWQGSEDAGSWNSSSAFPSLTSYVDDGADWAELLSKVGTTRDYSNEILNETSGMRSKWLDCWDNITSATWGLHASYDILGIVRTDVGATVTTTSTIDNRTTLIKDDTASIRSDVADVKRDVADIKRELEGLKDDFAEFNSAYDADIVERDRLLALINEQTSRTLTEITNDIMPRLNTISTNLDGARDVLGQVNQTVRTNGEQIAQVKGKCDEILELIRTKAVALMSAYNRVVYCVAKSVKTLLEPVYSLFIGADSYSSNLHIGTTDDGPAVTGEQQETDMVDIDGDFRTFQIIMRDVEGYGPFDAESGNQSYTYSDELKQVLAWPYRR